MRLSRNGRLAVTGVFSRGDLGLSPLAHEGPDAKSRADQARAQMLTSAAAFILVRLSTFHPDLREGLCGATEWRSVALQIIATSNSLADGEDVPKLLRTALTIDPGNGHACYEYIRSLGTQLKTAPHDEKVIAMYDALIERATGDDGPKSGWASLYPRIHYSAALASVNLCVARWFAGDTTAAASSLKTAREQVDSLERACRRPAGARWTRIAFFRKVNDEDAVDWTPGLRDSNASPAPMIKPFAENLSRIVEVLEGNTWDHEKRSKFRSPGLSFNYACLEALSLRNGAGLDDDGRAKTIKALLDDLAFAVGTADAKARARRDPYLARVRDDDDVAALIGRPAKPCLLDLPPFAPFRNRLIEAGFTSATGFVRGTGTNQQKNQTASFLGVPVGTVDYLHAVASLAEIHPDLDDVRMLRLLLELGVDSPAELRRRLSCSLAVPAFLCELRLAAKKHDLAGVPGSEPPYRWIKAASGTPSAEPR
jgi:hypothetical protein